MSLDCVRECADQARLDPCVQEFRTVRLTIRVYQWTGERVGSPHSSKELVSELAMPRYEVKEIGMREILASGGKLKKGDVRVRDISPPYTKADGVTQGGFTVAQLDPQSAWNAPDFQVPVRNREVEYVLSGEQSGIFTLLDLNTDDVTAWSLTLSLTRKTP